MAGGSGRRLWPLSREERPKQFLPLLGNASLLAAAIDRVSGLVARGNVYVAGCESHLQALAEAVRHRLPEENILLEPVGRNTAACAALSALRVAEGGDAVMCLLPADHHIEDVPAFQAVIRRAFDAAERTNGIVTVGVLPTYAATGFGYIRRGGRVDGLSGVYRVERFVEKPDASRAERYIAEGNCYWNCGIFVAKASVLKKSIRTFLPQHAQSVQSAYEAIRSGRPEEARAAYEAMPGISFDTGVLEKSGEVLMVPGAFGWSDIGSLRAIAALLQRDAQGNAVVSGDLRSIDAKGLTVFSTGRLVAAVGVEDLFIIDTGDVLCICRADQVERAGEIAKRLRDEGRGDLL